VGALNGGAAAILLAGSAIAGPQPAGGRNQGQERPAVEGIESWTAQVREASRRFGIPEEWIRRVIRAESGGRSKRAGRPVRSSAGAMGLMQLMPGTWAEMRSLERLGPDPYDPLDNILAGTAYLRILYDRFGYPGLFAAYHAGPGRYARFLAGRSRLPAETIAYLAELGAAGAARREAPPAIAGGPLFVPLTGGTASSVEPEPVAAAGKSGAGLFVRLDRIHRPRD
jgi:soluble lytic murein transglycosylase-like protein